MCHDSLHAASAMGGVHIAFSFFFFLTSRIGARFHGFCMLCGQGIARKMDNHGKCSANADSIDEHEMSNTSHYGI